LINEKIYNSNVPIKYVFNEGNVNKDHLVIMFSGFSENTAKVKHVYNYMRTLNDFDCNKLFILDNYGPTGSYYIGENMSYEVESSVLSLITFITRKYRIAPHNVILTGSSKGGTAALYFGLKYNFGHVIAGAFQTRITTYIKEHRPEAYAFMVGGDAQKEEQLNEIVYKQLEKEVLTNLFLMSSENDWQYAEHIEPFLNKLDELEIPYKYYECKNMKDHSDVGNHFPEFLMKYLLLIIYYVQLKKIDCKLIDNKKFTGKVEISVPLKDVQVGFVVQEQNQMVYECENEFEYTPTLPGFYSVFLQVKKDGQRFYQKELLNEFVGAERYNFYGANFRGEESLLKLDIETDSSELLYAYYIHKNGSLIDKIMYQPNNCMEFSLDNEGNGIYQVQFYIKDKFGKVAVSKTKPLKVN